MKVYLLRRVLAVIPVMLIVATVAFVLIHLAPGDPARFQAQTVMDLVQPPAYAFELAA